MNILCIMHADFEPPGIITHWAAKNHYPFTLCKPYMGETLPDIDNFDRLIIMGGPQNADDPLPYLINEITFIQSAIKKNKNILGICLGAQLIGEAVGVSVMKSPEKEIGIFSICLTDAGTTDPLLSQLPRSFSVLHWHGDMPGLSDHAIVLATSLGCPRQIIRFQTGVYGVQCHLEIEKSGILEMINACPNDFVPSLLTQTPEALLDAEYDTINNMMRQLLDNFVRLT